MAEKCKKKRKKEYCDRKKVTSFVFSTVWPSAPILLSSSAHIQSVDFADVLAMFIPEKAASVYSTVLMAFQLTLA